jgi:SAM-dependent methyltransferase
MEEINEYSYFDFLQADDSLNHFLGCDGMTTYIKMLNICQKNNIKKVYDIGCGIGWQSEIFLRGGVKYTGIDNEKLSFWKENMTDDINYIEKEYPFRIDSKPDEVVISSMCISWGCYFEIEEVKKQAKIIGMDFEQAILYLSKDKVRYFIEEFNNCEILQDDTFSKFVYLWN